MSHAATVSNKEQLTPCKRFNQSAGTCTNGLRDVACVCRILHKQQRLKVFVNYFGEKNN
jgi:hypothetical protein